MSMVGGMGYGWPSPFIPKLNGAIDPDMNPLPQPTTIMEDAWITSLHTLGSIFGPLFSGVLADKFGRKIVLIIFSLPMVAANIVFIFANSVTLFYIARFLLGIGNGVSISLIPAYVSEISETQNRGTTSLFMPLMICAIQNLLYFVGPYVTVRMMAMISLIPSCLFLVHFGFCVPESPYYYVLKDKTEEAEECLKNLRKTTDVKKELVDIIRNVEETRTKLSCKEIFFSRVLRKCFVITIGLMFFQQFSGILAIVSYSQTIFDSAGSSLPGYVCVMIIGVVQTLTVVITICIVDKINRKTLMIFSYAGMLVSLTTLGIYFYLLNLGYNATSFSWCPIASIMVYICCFNIAPGGLSWTILGEIFPPNVKSTLSSFAAVFVVTLAFSVSFIFPHLSKLLGMAWSMWTFAIFLSFGLGFLVFVLPETRKKTFSEIQSVLRGDNNVELKT
ncbi:unnamed protein product [Acanthoscelides obtectus]|uniref:Major facilitator superfamily (MFS) profile domain-containing protein n=1 Tax=Acanthoscelides obtectus TaxID=200917 RepID=A0A9P0KEM2_ACAOB|nr:unnamed protein product [Acanthoscelides obtectus]CAK1651013.1 Facilitated trehalose transporter Tret1 [Acanthoscelides obtectus]